MSAARKGGATRPSLLRALFASLRRPPADEPASPAPDPAPSEDPPSVRLLEGPERTRSPPRQISLLDPPEGRRGDRVVFVKDFVAIFQRLMIKSGVTARDPIAPVLEMLCEMLLHFTHLAEDQTAGFDRHEIRLAAELRTASEQARGIFGEEARRIDRSMARAAERIEATAAETRLHRENVLHGFREETEELFRTTMLRQTRARMWYDRTLVAVFVAVLAGAAFWGGRSWGIDETTVAMRAAQTRTEALLLRDGVKVAMHWLDLIEWNRLIEAPKSCAPQPSGPGYRQVCTFTFWDGPPLEEPPPR